MMLKTTGKVQKKMRNMLLETEGKVILVYSGRKIGRIVPIVSVGSRLSNELEYLNEEISKQNVEGAAWFLVVTESKM